MSHGRSDDDIVEHTRNTARFFTENRHISWVLLAGTILWGVYGYFMMPQRKDPDIPVKTAVALCPWPGASAEKIEQLVTRRIEEKMAENARIEKIESISRTSVSVVYVTIDKRVEDPGKQFDDIKLKLDDIHDLPDGAGPIHFIKDFGDTAALMLTVASPRVSETEIDLRARDVRDAIERMRATAPPLRSGRRLSGVTCFPHAIPPDLVRRDYHAFSTFAREKGIFRDIRLFEGAGFVGLDAVSDLPTPAIAASVEEFIQDRLHSSEIHPDSWPTTLIEDPADTRARLAAVAGERYSYRELSDFTELIKRTLQTVPIVTKVDLKGTLDERIYLEYSQERLASYGLRNSSLPGILSARNITTAGGILEIGEKNLRIDPSGEFKSEKEIGDVLLTGSPGTLPLYLRDVVEVVRAYDSPPRYLNYYTWRDPKGGWQRSRAITLAVQMRAGGQIGEFGKAVDGALNDLKQRLPEDLILARTSDQPLQVEESVDLFMKSLYEAIALVVVVSLVGFWEWRSALLMAVSMPITLAMTFGMMYSLGIDLQQISIASLIIALGLLVDDPVVAGDAIKRSLADGRPPVVAAWLGPTKLATAILYATITNIVAYLPFMFISGDTGRFLYSMPVVIGCSLVASRLVSMTFIPLLGYYILRPKAEPTVEERRRSGFAARYDALGSWGIRHRWVVLAGSFGFLALGAFFFSQLRTQFFPKDLSYISYIDVWLPEDAPLAATNASAAAVEKVVEEVADGLGAEHARPSGGSAGLLKSLTTFVGGGGPRFWATVSPELNQLNYAQVVVQVNDKHLTTHLVGPLQKALSARIPGARVDARLLETGAPVGVPVSIRISGESEDELRAQAARVKEVFRSIPLATRVRDDWGAESFVVRLQIDPDRANMAGITNQDVAGASATAMNGVQVSTLREGDKQIPVVARMRMEERAQLDDVQDLYVYSYQGTGRVPLRVISKVAYDTQTEKIRRRNQFRTITVSCFPEDGVLASEVMAAARSRLDGIARRLPPGYRLEIGGEEEEQKKGFKDLAIVMAISVASIFLALVLQFRHAVKPLIVFAAIPYGIVGALAALWVMGSPFGFMAFLGVASLVGVIVSHVIVLFDFIEEKHAEGEPLERALLDAGIMRLRPVLITVGATVIALFPLASHGGPLWEPMCYAQIGGLTVATFITLLLVPVIYSIFVLDLKLVRWGAPAAPPHAG